MQRIVRHRKAFYQKQNDLKNGNINFQYQNKYNDNFFPNNIVKNNQNNIMYQSISSSSQKLQTVQIKPSQYQSQYQSPYSHVNFCQISAPKNETQYFCENYCYQVLNNPTNYQLSARFLKNHKIDSHLRARMLDWMIEVTSSYKFNNKTYFAGINIMDRYFQKQSQHLQPTDLHIIGIVSMLIASKMQQVYPLKLSTVYQKIAHKKMSQRDLTNQQSKISQTLNYKLNSWTFFDLSIAKLHILIQNLNKRKPRPFRNLTNNNYLTSSYSNQKQRQKALVDQIQERVDEIQDVCSYISKHLYYDYQFFCSYSLAMLSDVVLKLTFEVLKIPCQFQSISTSPQIQVQLCKEKIVQKIRQFDFKFKGLNNLKKFTNPDITKLVQRELQ